MRIIAFASRFPSLFLLSTAMLIACTGYSGAGDEKIKRFQSLTLNGQIADTGKILDQGAMRYSKERLCLILFGDADDSKVQEMKAKSTDTLKYMASMGHNMALLHVDTAVYKDGPKDIFWENDETFVSPSFLVYVDGLQMSYHPTISDEELRHIKGAMVIYEDELMGWAKGTKQKASEELR